MNDRLGHVPATRATAVAVSRIGTARDLLLAVIAMSAVTVAAMVPWSSTAAAATGTVDVATNASFGPVLTDARGFALYTFSSDHNGMSACSGTCAQVWPALTVPAGTSPTAGPGVTGTLAAVLQADGTYQVTYNGSPLYTFASDSSPGEVTGNGVAGFSVVTVAAPAPASAPTTPVTTRPPAATTTPTSTAVQVAPSSGSTSPAGVSSSKGQVPAPATASSSGSTPATTSGSLAFTGPGRALMWVAVSGVGLVVVGIPMLMMVGIRRARHRGSRAGG